MSTPATGLIGTLIGLLDEETSALRAGRFSRVADTAERKARLMHQLAHMQAGVPSTGNLIARLEVLRNALRSNLRACMENIESLKDLIALQMAVEQDLENDGTYAMPGRQARST